MLHSEKVAKAVRFSIKTHEVYQKQKRKGKDIPYITHPLIVGLILARAGATENQVVAGILHDTIEDSPTDKRVTKEMLIERFGREVAVLVDAVTEQDKSLSWEQRKAAALHHISQFSRGALLVKSADIISNTTELIDDYRREGETTFARFNAGKEKALGHTLDAIGAILRAWKENPLAADLRNRARELKGMLAETA